MATQEDIEAHYDVGNDFFELILDKQFLAYTTGIWSDATTLEEAQQHKFDRLTNFANIQQGNSVLDVGCGWGGYLNHLSHQFNGDIRPHGLTISTQQYEYINQHKKEGVTADLCPWQEYSCGENQKFDAIVSVCAFEHFATIEDNKANRQIEIYKNFFDWCLSVSTDDAKVAIQTIVMTRPPENIVELKGSQYLQKVFPGSAMATISDIQEAILGKYEIFEAKRVGVDYVKTLAAWNERLEQNKETIISTYSAELYEHYRRYFTGASECFKTGYFDVLQISLKRAIPVRFFKR